MRSISYCVIFDLSFDHIISCVGRYRKLSEKKTHIKMRSPSCAPLLIKHHSRSTHSSRCLVGIYITHSSRIELEIDPETAVQCIYGGRDRTHIHTSPLLKSPINYKAECPNNNDMRCECAPPRSKRSYMLDYYTCAKAEKYIVRCSTVAKHPYIPQASNRAQRHSHIIFKHIPINGRYIIEPRGAKATRT